MNLTNDQAEGCPTEESTSFSKYFGSEDHDEDEYNYSESNINDTLLLEATLLDSKQDLAQHFTTPLLNHLKEEHGSISREKSLVFDLCGDLSISESQLGSCTDGPPEKSNQKISDLYNICTKLVDTISKL